MAVTLVAAAAMPLGHALSRGDIAPTRLRGELKERAELVRALISKGEVEIQLPNDVPPKRLILQTSGQIQRPAGGIARLLVMAQKHGMIADDNERGGLVQRLCREPLSEPQRVGCWLDVVVWAHHLFVDGAALGARSQSLPPHLKRPSRKMKAASALDHANRRARAVAQVAALATHPHQIEPQVQQWLTALGPGGWQPYIALVSALGRYRKLTTLSMPALPAEMPVAHRYAWKKRKLRRKWARRITAAHKEMVRTRLCFEGYCAAQLAPQPEPPKPAKRKRRRRVRKTVLPLPTHTQLRAWQRDRGLRDHGLLDKATLRAFAVPMSERVTTIRLALQRVRDTAVRATGDVLVANIPAFRLDVWRDGKLMRQHRTQVGKGIKRRRGRWVPGLKTPLISSRLRYLVLNPEWVVPTSIRREYRYKVKRDPDYFAKHGFEQRTSKAGTTLVMKAGAGNLLGRVKFLFPNQHLVYLHDTPSQWAFQRPRRTTSHGCVRVQDADKLAQYLLKQPHKRAITEKKWDKMMKRYINKWKPLRRKVDVHLVYWTADVGANGRVRFYPDVYHNDSPDRARWAAADRARLEGLTPKTSAHAVRTARVL
ncbi:MAG: L,D-transpeptidase family protein [Myxococcales bacterium]|nr:L,D-transpeptidase family protein [Myxococcales bacterium]